MIVPKWRLKFHWSCFLPSMWGFMRFWRNFESENLVYSQRLSGAQLGLVQLHLSFFVDLKVDLGQVHLDRQTDRQTVKIMVTHPAAYVWESEDKKLQTPASSPTCTFAVLLMIWFLVFFYCNRGWKKFRTFIASTFGYEPCIACMDATTVRRWKETLTKKLMGKPKLGGALKTTETTPIMSKHWILPYQLKSVTTTYAPSAWCNTRWDKA